MCSETIHIAGRYNKYMRNLSQSPWIDKNDIRIKDSVQEMIEDGLNKYLKFDKAIFSSSGREDVDVRMLGNGRPFVFKITNPNELYSKQTMKQMENFINDKYCNQIRIKDLQIVSKESVTKFMRDGDEGKNKEYKALCCCSRKLTQEDIEKINSIKDQYINQKTPIRVLHRRTLAVRSRKIYRMKIDRVKIGDFESVNENNLDNVFALTLLTEAGTYIKEFVHGDFGRTEPSLATLLDGNCETDLMELDVMEVYLDWPPPCVEEIPLNNSSEKCPLQTSTINDSEINLSELYNKCLADMKKAESMPRGDQRQDLYLQTRRNLEKAISLVEDLNLFSENEQLEDVATGDLKYMLLPAYLAKVLISSELSSDRLTTFTRAELLMKSFLTRISKYGLGNNAIENSLKSDVNLKGNLDTTSLGTAMQSRNDKIENFKKMKILEEKICELERRLNLNQEVDDEVAREYYTSLVRKYISESYDSLENEIKPALFFEKSRSLNFAAKQESTSAQKTSNSNQPKTFTIVKDNLQKQVFGLGYPSRPTVTVDEFIQTKFDSGELAFQKHKEVYGNSLQRYAEKPDLLKEQEELSDAEHDDKEDKDDEEELKKKRRWDEFTDENPRGSGNRHNMG